MTETVQRKTLEQLDAALFYSQDNLRVIAEMLSASLKNTTPEETPFLDIVRAGELLSRTVEKLVIVAPYLVFRNDYEAIERLKEWVTESMKYIGDQRADIILMLIEYQRDLITQTGRTSNGQMVLL
jgi:hypothetical protein